MTRLHETVPIALKNELAAALRPSVWARVERQYEVREYDRTELRLVPCEYVHVVKLSQGRLFIDGRAVPNPRFGRTFVAFSATDGAVNLSGVLDFTPDGGALCGTMYRSLPDGSATTAIHVAGVAPPVSYQTRLGTTGAAAPAGQNFPTWSPPTPSSWEASATVTLSYMFDQNQVPIPAFNITTNQGTLDVTAFAATSVVARNNSLLVAIDPGDALDAWVDALGNAAPAQMRMEFSESGVSFSGSAQRVVGSDGSYDASAESYGFEGTWDEGAATRSVPETSERVAESGSSRPLAEFKALDSGNGLGVLQLFTLQVDNAQLHNQQFNELLTNMKWALGYGQVPGPLSLLKFFGEEPPSLPDARTEVIKQDLGFYTATMAPSYLGSAINNMQGPGAPTTRLTDAQLNDLEFFHRAGLPANAAFSRQAQALFRTAFVEITQDQLGPYLADQQAHTVDGKVDPAHDWGAKLFAEVTDPIRLNLTYNGAANGFGLSSFSRHSSLLMALDPSGAYAVRYHKALLSRSLGASIEHLALNDKAAVSSWLELGIKAIITNFNATAADLPIDPEIAKLMRQLGQDLQDAVNEAGSATQLAQALADLILAADAGRTKETTIWATLRTAETFWGQAGYVFFRGIYAIAIVAGLVSAIVAFLDWNSLTQVQQGSLVTSTVDTACKVIQGVVEIVAGEWSFDYAPERMDAAVSNSSGQSALDFVSFEAMESAGSNIADAGGQLAGTGWAARFNLQTFGTVMEVISAVAATVLAVLSTVAFTEDIENGEPVSTDVLDGIIMAANIGVAILAFVAICSSLAFVPILAAIMAAIGVIATLIEMLIPRPQPETPAEHFMEDTLLPAVTGPNRWILASPPGWRPGMPIPSTNAYNPST